MCSIAGWLFPRTNLTLLYEIIDVCHISFLEHVGLTGFSRIGPALKFSRYSRAQLFSSVSAWEIGSGKQIKVAHMRLQ